MLWARGGTGTGKSLCTAQAAMRTSRHWPGSRYSASSLLHRDGNSSCQLDQGLPRWLVSRDHWVRLKSSGWDKDGHLNQQTKYRSSFLTQPGAYHPGSQSLDKTAMPPKGALPSPSGIPFLLCPWVFSHRSFHHCLLVHWSLGLTDSYTERFLGSQVVDLELSYTVTFHGSPVCRWPNVGFSAPVTTKSNCPTAALPVNHRLCLHLHPCGPWCSRVFGWYGFFGSNYVHIDAFRV